MKKFLALAMVFAASAFGTISWQTNYDQALAQAKKENKSVVLFFQGSDWCGPCKKLKAQVFENAQFQKRVQDQFVFVELDFPKDKSGQSQQEQNQNRELSKKYGVAGYPAVVVVNPDGTKIQEIKGYSGEGWSQYADRLTSSKGSPKGAKSSSPMKNGAGQMHGTKSNSSKNNGSGQKPGSNSGSPTNKGAGQRQKTRSNSPKKKGAGTNNNSQRKNSAGQTRQGRTSRY